MSLVDGKTPLPEAINPLPYGYDALTAAINEETMKLHHDKHHAGYLSKARGKLEDKPELLKKPVDELLSSLNSLPEDLRTPVRNFVGGYINHAIFWESMKQSPKKAPDGPLAEKINGAFGSLDSLKEKFNSIGGSLFGSGWVWLYLSASGDLELEAFANQDAPALKGGTPLLGNDVWEHAYYLTHKNNKAEYLKAWWEVADWESVETRFSAAAK